MSSNSKYLGSQRCCYSKTPITGAQGAQGARGPIGPFGLTGSTGPKGATGGSPWIATNAIGPQGAGYTGIGVTGMDVLIGGNLLVTGGIDPTYLALTPQPSGPQGFINPLWVDNDGNLRSDKILLDNTSVDPLNTIISPNNITFHTGDPLLTGTLSGTEFNVINKVTSTDGYEKFSKITSTGLLVQDNVGIGYAPTYTNISTTGITIQTNDGSSIYTFGATGTQCRIDSRTDNLVLNSGLLILNNIPTSNPGVTGAVWNDGGILKIA